MREARCRFSAERVRGAVAPLTDSLLETCWIAGGVKAGYLCDRPIFLDPRTRRGLATQRRRKVTAGETFYAVENWADDEIGTFLAYRQSDAHHLLGLSRMPPRALTGPRLARLGATSMRRDWKPNPWLAQCTRILERKDIPTDRRVALLEANPQTLASRAVTRDECAAILAARKDDGNRDGSLLESAAANPNLSNQDATTLIEGFDPRRGDHFTRQGMRQLVRVRGRDPEMMDALTLVVMRIARSTWPRLESSVPEMVRAAAFRQEHYECIGSHLERIGFSRGVLLAWSGAPAADVLGLLSGSARDDGGATAFALQNPSLSAAVQLEVARIVLPKIVSDPIWMLASIRRLSEGAGNLIADRLLNHVDGTILGALLAIPELDARVTERLIRNHSGLLQRREPTSPSALMVMLATAPLNDEGVWYALEKIVDSMEPEEMTAAAAHLQCPDYLKVKFLFSPDNRGVALAIAANPKTGASLRNAGIAALPASGVPNEIAELLQEHGEELAAE